MKKRLIYTILTVVFIILYVMPAMAQFPPIPQLPTLPVPGEGSAPIDGGLSLLIAAGVGYGAKKLRNKK